MKKFLVHLHIFYEDMYSEFKQYLINLGAQDNYDLFVSMVKPCLNIENDLKINFPNAKLFIVENKGYDIAPFVEVLKKVDLDNYEYVIKLHTKRDVKVDALPKHLLGCNWRDSLTKFISTKEIFDNVVNTMDHDKHIGMNSDSSIIFSNICDYAEEKAQFYNFLKSYNFKVMPYKFVAGSMFIARSCVFKDLQKLSLGSNDFEAPDLSKNTFQTAHAVERLLGYLVSLNNLKLVDCNNQSIIDFKYLKHVLSFKFKIFSNVFNNEYLPKLRLIKVLLWDDLFCKYIVSVRKTKKNKILIKLFRIPIYSYKLKEKN